LDQGDFNFIFLDWSAGSTTSNYLTARNRVSEAGSFLGAFIDWLHENNLADFKQISIVGFSLGAHVAGFAGKTVRRGRINTIIGLDPAGEFEKFQIF
jgi:pancreatic triacylglycerol lipase